MTPANSRPIDEMSVQELSQNWYELFNRNALDLNLDTQYTRADCIELSEMGIGTRRIAKEKKLLLLSHYYMRPEIQKVSDFVHDSLGLGLKTQELIQDQANTVSAV